MKRIIKAGNTSNILHVFISDTTSQTGAGLTGLAYNSAGLTAWYIRPGQTAATAITLATATVGTYASGGFIQIDATNMPGWYEFDPPDACFATASPQPLSCSLILKGGPNMAPLPIEVQLDVNTVADNNALLTNGTYGLAQLVRATTPANTLYTSPAGGVSVVTVTDKTGYALTSAEHTAIGTDVSGQTIEGSLTWAQMEKLILAAVACKSNGGGTATIKFRNVADNADRITATVDSNGNRTAVTLVGT